MMIPINEQRNAVLSNVNTSTVSATLLSENKKRIGAVIVNESSVVMYVKFGATASATSYTVALAASASYALPFGYNGRVDAILASSTGVARITEIL